MTTTPDRLADLGKLIAAHIPGLIDEARDQLNESINATVEDSQAKEDGKAILSINISVKWDLNGNSVVVSMPVNVRRKFESVGRLEDPQQPSLIEVHK